MLHHVAVALLASPGVHHLVHEGDLLDGVDGVEIMFDSDAVLSEVCGDALFPVDGLVARTGLCLLETFLLTPRPHTTNKSHLSPTFRSISLSDEAGGVVDEVVVDPVLAANSAALFGRHIPRDDEVTKGSVVVLQFLY